MRCREFDGTQQNQAFKWSLGSKIVQKRRLMAENRKNWLKMPYQAYFGPPVQRGKIFLSLAAEWDLLEIWSGRKYVRTREIVR